MTGPQGKARKVRFALNIPPDVLLSYYEGAARSVAAKTLDGRAIQFPANVLRQFVSGDGVRGIFEMAFDENNKFVSMRRVSD